MFLVDNQEFENVKSESRNKYGDKGRCRVFFVEFSQKNKNSRRSICRMAIISRVLVVELNYEPIRTAFIVRIFRLRTSFGDKFSGSAKVK